MEIYELKQKIKRALDEFYQNDIFLLENGLCERCLTHRFAVWLERQNFNGYFIDCEYNKSHLNTNTSTKIVSNPNGNYIDIVITKRTGNYVDDLVCFEIKRTTTYTGKATYSGRTKDRENLKILTGGKTFSYSFGIYLLLDVDVNKTKLEIYQNGKKTEDYSLVKL